MHSILACAASVFLLVGAAHARTDLRGCVSSKTVVYGGASLIWYVPGTGEICSFVDCGGGRAPPKTTQPGCVLYEGTATVTPSYLPGFGGAPTASETGGSSSGSITGTAAASTTTAATSSGSAVTSSVSTATAATSASTSDTGTSQLATATGTTTTNTTSTTATGSGSGSVSGSGSGATATTTASTATAAAVRGSDAFWGVGGAAAVAAAAGMALL